MSRLPNSGEIGKENYMPDLKNEIIIIFLWQMLRNSHFCKSCKSAFPASQHEIIEVSKE
jgi:hypothetical protein